MYLGPGSIWARLLSNLAESPTNVHSVTITHHSLAQNQIKYQIKGLNWCFGVHQSIIRKQLLVLTIALLYLKFYHSHENSNKAKNEYSKVDLSIDSKQNKKRRNKCFKVIAINFDLSDLCIFPCAHIHITYKPGSCALAPILHTSNSKVQEIIKLS